MGAFYNEIDRYCCDWLSNLMDAGLITAGKIDDRPIQELTPDNVRGCERVHFFAGIAGWDHALNLAGWEGPVWTGSCPCQPLSVAGQRKGHADERHVWPAFHCLIAECKPPVVFGEQVASKDGREWLAAVRADLEDDGYAVGAADLCAASVGAPHIRQRLWWVAKSDGRHQPQECAGNGEEREQRTQIGRRAVVLAGTGATGGDGGMADTDGRDASTEGLQRSGKQRFVAQDRRVGELDNTAGARQLTARQGAKAEARDQARVRGPERGRPNGELADAADFGLQGREFIGGGHNECSLPSHQSPWSDLIWLPCTDGKARPTKPGIFPLAHGVSARVGKLRAAGNAIVAPIAAEFVKAFR